MPAFIDKAASGLETWVDQSEDPTYKAIHYRQDVEPVLEWTKSLRNNHATDSGIKRDFWHFASIPPVVILKLKFEHGVDVFNRNHQKKLFELLNTEYKYLKTTDLRHTVRD